MKKIPEIHGLVLAGGKSRRMGSDKGWLHYHHMPQRVYLHKLLSGLCTKAFVSIRADQKDRIPKGVKTLVDLDHYRGPFNGILTAHALYPEAAWLVLACDLPLIDRESLLGLLEQRDPGSWATSFATRKSGLPEPMATLWEPRGLKGAVEYLATAKSSCPRKFLLNAPIKLVHPKSDRVLFNANSPEDFVYIKAMLFYGA